MDKVVMMIAWALTCDARADSGSTLVFNSMAFLLETSDWALPSKDLKENSVVLWSNLLAANTFHVWRILLRHWLISDQNNNKSCDPPQTLIGWIFRRTPSLQLPFSVAVSLRVGIEIFPFIQWTSGNLGQWWKCRH